MKVVHVITRLGRDCGGPVRSVQGLVAALGEAGVEAWLLSITTEARPWLPGVISMELKQEEHGLQLVENEEAFA